MRMTVEQLHKGECLPFTPENTLVQFNGSYIMAVVAGDDEEGWLDVVDMEKYENGMDEFPTKRIYGEVKFVLLEDVK